MKKREIYHAYRHYVDVSGSIGIEDIFIGNILFNERFRNKFLGEFYSEFPNLQSFRKKGAVLNNEKLLQIIDFMNKKRIRMSCLKFPLFKYKRSLRDVKEKLKSLVKEPYISYPRERMLAPLYFYLLKENSYKKKNYEGQVCIESQIKIDKVLSKMGYVARNNNYGFYLSVNHRRNQHMLKFADFVASVGRKLEDFQLSQFKYYKIIIPEIKEKDLKIAFGINKIEADKQKILNKKKHYTITS